MVHLWGSRAKEEAEISKSALGECGLGDVAVVLNGDKLDNNLVYLGCQMAKGAKRKVHLVHVIEVPRALPLKATNIVESEKAETLLQQALQLAEKIGADAVAEVVQAREAGPAIVDEARDHHIALILLGCLRQGSPAQCREQSEAVMYVLQNAPCRVWLVQDPAPKELSSLKEKEAKEAKEVKEPVAKEY